MTIYDYIPVRRVVLQYNPDSRERAIFAKSGEMHPSGVMHPWRNEGERRKLATSAKVKLDKGEAPTYEEMRAHLHTKTFVPPKRYEPIFQRNLLSHTVSNGTVMYEFKHLSGPQEDEVIRAFADRRLELHGKPLWGDEMQRHKIENEILFNGDPKRVTTYTEARAVFEGMMSSRGMGHELQNPEKSPLRMDLSDEEAILAHREDFPKNKGITTNSETERALIDARNEHRQEFERFKAGEARRIRGESARVAREKKWIASIHKRKVGRVTLPPTEPTVFRGAKLAEGEYVKSAEELYTKLKMEGGTNNPVKHELHNVGDLSPVRVEIREHNAEVMSKDIKDHTGEDVSAQTIRNFEDKWSQHVTDSESMYLQESVVNHFDITVPPLFDRRLEGVLKLRSSDMDHDPVLEHQAELIAASQYRLTQQYYKDRGITHVTLYRGVSFSSKEDPFQRFKYGVDSNETIIESFPLSSWSIATGPARDFSWVTDSYGYVMTSRIPVERIFSNGITGHGAVVEGEHIVIGGDMSVNVMRTHEPNDGIPLEIGN